MTLADYLLVALASFMASTVAGLSGYGTGLLMPLVLVPLIGPEPVVPIVSLSAIVVNGSRAFAFRDVLDRRTFTVIALAALPTSLLGAYGYTRLSGPAVLVLLGVVLIVLVPARRMLRRKLAQLSTRQLAVAGTGYGFLVGGTSGVGVVLLSLLMAAGLEGPAVIATDAAISLVIGIAKISIFQAFGALPLSSWIMAAVIGGASVPAAFVARRLSKRMTLSQHTAILDAVAIVGGAALLWQGLKAN